MVGAATQLLRCMLHESVNQMLPGFSRAFCPFGLQVGGTDGGERQLSSWPSSAGSVESAFLAVMELFKKDGLSAQQNVRWQILGGCIAPEVSATAYNRST